MGKTTGVDSAWARLLAAVGVAALALALLPLTSASANHGDADYPVYNDFPGSPGQIVERDAEDGLPETVRYRGSSRHDTAGQIATDNETYFDSDGFSDADEVVLARADEFPDALAGSYLAGIFGAPILLVDTSGPIEPHTQEALEIIDPETVTVLGGTDAITDQAANDAAAISGADIDRVFGSTRFETAEAIAGVGDVAELGGERTVFLATGLEFADALVAGQIASFEEHPILLTTPDSLHSAADRALDDNDVDQVIILGQTNAISAGVEAEVEAKGIETMRVGDADRAGTATMVAQLAIDTFDFDPAHVNVATGFNFPDALAMGPHAGEEAAPLILARGNTFLDGADGNDTQPSEFLADFACETGSVHLAGGQDAMSEGLEDAIRDASECVEEESLTLDLSPQTTTVGETVTATATLNVNGDPIDGDTIDFETEHSDEEGEVVVLAESNETDADGEATLEFTTAEAGDVLVTATWEEGDESVSDTATFVELIEPTPFDFDIASEREVGDQNGAAGGDAEGEATVLVGANADGQWFACATLDVEGVGGSIEDWNDQALHIHEGEFDENGPIVVHFNNPIQVDDTAFKPLECVGIEESLATDIVTDPGGHYLNLHTDLWPGGNARGQLDGSWDGEDRSDDEPANG